MSGLQRKRLVAVLVLVSAIAAGTTSRVSPRAAPPATDPAAKIGAGIVATAPGWVDVAGGTRHLGARGDGIVERVAVQVGDTVEAGALLIQLDGRQAQTEAQLAELEARRNRQQQTALVAQVARARGQIARLAPLVAAQAEAGDVLDEQQRSLADLQAQLALARFDGQTAALQSQAAHERLARLELRAPVRGRVLRVSARSGEAVHAGDELLWFAADGALIVRAELDERLFGAVAVGMSAQVGPEYDDTQSYPARVTRIAQSVGPVRDLPEVRAAAKDDRVVECELELTAPAKLLIGQRVLVRIRAPGAGG